MRKRTARTQRIIPSILGTLILLIVVGLIFGLYLRPNMNVLGEQTQQGAQSTATFSIVQGLDAANEDGVNFSVPIGSNENLWFGTGQYSTKSFLGLRFSGATLPKGTKIASAKIEFTPTREQWISVKTSFYGDTSTTPAQFSTTNLPSARPKTQASKTYVDNVKWAANTVYSYDVSQIVQELVNSQERSVLSIIIKGEGGAWGRKFIYGAPQTGKSPKLIVTYQGSGSSASSTGSTPTPTKKPGVTSTPTATSKPTSVPSVTPTPTAQAGQPAMLPPTGSGTASKALGKWSPSKWDTCTKEQHDAYSVIGPDGKRYPTWHPPTGSGGCRFGHEHGRDPSKSLIWNDIRNHFAYDADKNGQISSSELASAGIPFGYVNEQLDTANTGYMRHEDHVGHKIDYANGEPDMATDQFNNSPNDGVVVPAKTSSGNPKWNDTGARCFHLAKVHQGVSTHDAFTNNLHEVMYFVKCNGPTSAYDMESRTMVMMEFGKAGEFTNLCDGDGDRTTPIVLGTTDANKNFPGSRSNGARNIIQRSCVEKHFLVPQGKFSMNFYEAWPGTITITSKDGRRLAWGMNLLFDVEDANRYYYPGKPNNIGYSMELCYEQLSGGRQARGGTCDTATNYRRTQGITWDDPRSAFRGIHRGMYFMPPVLENAGGGEVWYTDPFGRNAQKTPFTGSIKQYLSSKNVNHNRIKGQTDPRVNDRVHDDGRGTVHAPN